MGSLGEPLEEVRKPKSDFERVQELQRKLGQKAKEEKSFRFYILYDKLQVDYVLNEAYARCKRKGGAPGVDGVRFEDIEEGRGVSGLLEEIKTELRALSYRSQAVKRTYIPKANGKMRPLGIPTIKDRIIQMACKLVIEPIFEADFEDDSYGFRPGRSAKDAIAVIKGHIEAGRCEVFDADLSAYFDTIPHDELMILLRKRISDKRVLQLIWLWLKAPVWEEGKISGGKGSKTGTPQGGVISPLLANIYMNLIDKAINRRDGRFHRAGIRIVRYADDFVLMARKLDNDALEYLRACLSRMKLKLNEEKTRIVDARQTSFSFLGFTFEFARCLFRENARYLRIAPSKKSEARLRENIRTTLAKGRHFSTERLVSTLNDKIRGWANYFVVKQCSYPKKALNSADFYLREALYFYFAKKKSQRRCRVANHDPFMTLIRDFGLIRPGACAPALISSEHFR